MRKFLLAIVASTLLAGTAQAVTFNGDASFNSAINVVNPGFQAKANVIKNAGPQGFTSIDLDFDLVSVGNTFFQDLFVVRTLSAASAADDFVAKAFGLVFSFGQGSAIVTGTTYAKAENGFTFGVIDFDGPVSIALGNAQVLMITLADATFNTGAGTSFTPGKANGAVVGATFELAAIPLPATLPLALGAFAALAFVARRRKSAAQV